MRNIDELKTELACLQSESKIVEQELLGTVHGYVDSVKSVFSSVTGKMPNSNIYNGRYINSGSWVNNVFVKALQKSIKLFSPFLLTILTPKSKKWYAPFIASFISYGLRAVSCINYVYILKLIFNTIANNKYKPK